MKKIIVDIDNTLWDLAPVLYEHLKRVAPALPPPARWEEWNFLAGYAEDKDLYKTLRDIHSVQDRFGVYPDAAQFLANLKNDGLYIIIASHREKGTMDATLRWLKKHGLLFDEVHLSNDKTVLFDDCWAVVDDSPLTLEKAEQAGIIRTGLRNPWNEKEDHPLFDCLDDIYAYLKGQYSTERP